MKGKASIKQRALTPCQCDLGSSMLRAQSLGEGVLVVLLQSRFWGAGGGQELHWFHCVSADPQPYCGFYL